VELLQNISYHLIPINEFQPFCLDTPVVLSLNNFIYEFLTLFFDNLPFNSHELLDFTALIHISISAFLGCQREIIPAFSFLLLTFHQNLRVVVNLFQIFTYDVLVFESTSHSHVIVPFCSLQRRKLFINNLFPFRVERKLVPPLLKLLF
jgi:hypothetical protein